MHCSQTSSWSNQFGKCSDSITRQKWNVFGKKSFKKKPKFNINCLKIYVSSDTLKLLCFEPRQTEKNAKKIFQSSRKCHQICTFWEKNFFWHFHKLFSQIISQNIWKCCSNTCLNYLGRIMYECNINYLSNRYDNLPKYLHVILWKT